MYQTREEKLSELYLKLIDATKTESLRFKELQSKAVKIGSIRNKYNYLSYDITSVQLMTCVIRLAKLNIEIEDVSNKLGLPF